MFTTRLINVVSSSVSDSWWSGEVVQRDQGDDKWWIKSIEIKLNHFSWTSILGATIHVGSTLCATFPATIAEFDDSTKCYKWGT